MIVKQTVHEKTTDCDYGYVVAEELLKLTNEEFEELKKKATEIYKDSITIETVCPVTGTIINETYELIPKLPN